MSHTSTGTKQGMQDNFEFGSFVVDFYMNSNPEASRVFHYIITRKGTRQIIHWGQEPSREQAQEAALAVLQDLTDSMERVAS